MNHLLKLDPSNTVLLAQKQELLQAAIGDTEKKLEALEQAQEDVAKAFERGDLGKDQYMAFQREVEETRGTLNRYKADLSGLQSEQERLSSNTGRLNKLFAATGSNVDDYADVLGSRLVTAIKNGTASSDQLKTAIEKIGKSATGGKADIKQLTDALDTVDDGQAVRNLIDDLNDVGDAVQDALRGVNSLMKQYGMTAQEAMDYIVRGTQNGLDKTNELGDNLSEYAGKFEQAGYSASEYFQLLQNGLEGGAYNLDKVNDAINEVTTRLADGTIGDSLDLYSEKTQSLFQAWQSGEATQKQVIDSIVADIGNCTSQQEALNMAAKAFGTMAEDGNLKFITSLTSVGDAYDSVSGSAQNLFDQTQTPMQEMEANTWKLQQALVPLGEKIVELANVVLPPLVAIITAVSFGALNISLLPVIGIIAGGGLPPLPGSSPL